MSLNGLDASHHLTKPSNVLSFSEQERVREHRRFDDRHLGFRQARARSASTRTCASLCERLNQRVRLKMIECSIISYARRSRTTVRRFTLAGLNRRPAELTSAHLSRRANAVQALLDLLLEVGADIREVPGRLQYQPRCRSGLAGFFGDLLDIVGDIEGAASRGLDALRDALGRAALLLDGR